MSRLKVIELFAGIGSQAKALKRIRANAEVIDIVEYDKYAVTSYNAIHGTDFKPKDIRAVESLADCDILTYSFPCQDISVAGKLAGIKQGTRSGLLKEVERLLEEYESRNALPHYLIMENVKNLIQTKFMGDFKEWCFALELLGYDNYYQVLNAKDYEMPQSRERVIMVSIKRGGGLQERFEFPPPVPLVKKLCDVLEPEVDDKYYVSDVGLAGILNSTYMQAKRRIQEKDYCDTLCARDFKAPQCICVGNLSGGKWDKLHDISRRVYSEDGISPCIHTSGGGNTEVKVAIGAFRGRNPDNASDRTAGAPTEQRLEINPKGIANTLTTVQKDNVVVIIDDLYRGREPRLCEDVSPTLRSTRNGLKTGVKGIAAVRRLTPLEYWRLMDFDDADFYRAREVLEDTYYKGQDKASSQLYKQAGNSIVVKVLECVFSCLQSLEKCLQSPK